MVGDDHGRADIFYLIRNAPFHPGREDPQEGEKRPVEPMVQPLKGLFAAGRKPRAHR